MITELSLNIHYILGEGIEPLRKHLANVETRGWRSAEEPFGILDDLKRARLYSPNRGGVIPAQQSGHFAENRSGLRRSGDLRIVPEHLDSTIDKKKQESASITLGNNAFPWTELPYFVLLQQFEDRKHVSNKLLDRTSRVNAKARRKRRLQPLPARDRATRRLQRCTPGRHSRLSYPFELQSSFWCRRKNSSPGLAWFLLSIQHMPEQMQRPPVQSPWEKKPGDDSGPKAPNISRPDTNSLLKRLRSIDPDQSRKYRQRSGQ